MAPLRRGDDGGKRVPSGHLPRRGKATRRRSTETSRTTGREFCDIEVVELAVVRQTEG